MPVAGGGASLPDTFLRGAAKRLLGRRDRGMWGGGVGAWCLSRGGVVGRNSIPPKVSGRKAAITRLLAQQYLNIRGNDAMLG